MSSSWELIRWGLRATAGQGLAGRTLMALISHTNDQGLSWPSQTTLAAEVYGLDVDQVKPWQLVKVSKSVKWLTDRGLITVKRNHRQIGGVFVNQYQVTPDLSLRDAPSLRDKSMPVEEVRSIPAGTPDLSLRDKTDTSLRDALTTREHPSTTTTTRQPEKKLKISRTQPARETSPPAPVDPPPVEHHPFVEDKDRSHWCKQCTKHFGHNVHAESQTPCTDTTDTPTRPTVTSAY